jgi:glutamate dehydrogenase
MAPMVTQSGKKKFKSLVEKLVKNKNGKSLSKFASFYLDRTPESEVIDLINNRENFHKYIEHSFSVMKSFKPGNIHVNVYRAQDTSNIVIEAYLEDGPFLVDSLWEEMQDRGLEVRHTFHPVLLVKRDKNGKLIEFKENTDAGDAPDGYNREVLIHMELEYIPEDHILEELEKRASYLLTEACAVKKDFVGMVSRMEEVIAKTAASKTAAKHTEEKAFFEWLIDKNYIFLGYRHYTISHQGKKTYMELTKRSGLGVLRDDRSSSVYDKKCLDDVPPNLKHYYSNKKDFVTITKANTKSPVHRRADMDYIGVKEFDSKGNIIGEHRFLGLLTSRAYTTSPREIPIVRQKIEKVIASQSNLHCQSHNFKALVNILEMYPRDELFQIDVEDLQRISTGILNLKERQQVRLFVRQSRHELVTTAMIFVPIERMSSALRKNIIALLSESYNAEDVEFLVSVGESRLARLYLKIRSKEPAVPQISEKEIEKKVREISRSWHDDLEHELCDVYGEKHGLGLHKKYKNAFRAGYRENNNVCMAMQDITSFENMYKNTLRFLVSITIDEEKNVHLKVMHKDGRISLSKLMPTFNNMGLHVTDENSTLIEPTDSEGVWVHDFEVDVDESQQCIYHDNVRGILTEAVERAWYGELENDSLNALIVEAGLPVRDIVYLRAFVAYLQQCVMPYSKEYIRQTLIKHAGVARDLCELFATRFDPKLKETMRDKQEKSLNKRLEETLAAVQSLDEDMILRQIWGVIKACLRTNAFQTEEPTAPLAFKVESAKVPNLPKPHPLFDIFVYHSTVEGVHLRGGMVARGGLRWSDRPEDFRTEVLGLMKTQMTKNAVIVPVGSKGGFVLKAEPESKDRASMMQAVQTAYKIFIHGLLSVTDNLHEGHVIKPRDVITKDIDDPYLVVAADKGTATFSDLANEQAITADYWDGLDTGFWLGDAFASGGSNGYDHKKMGITARGAWECVKHHFREMSHNIQTEDFTCIGIGDMAGDVFGNGMLLSKHTKLVAAFNHMHIFFDPEPDTEKSFKERIRLFKNPRLSWADYDKKLISKGGGIFSRKDKSITLTKEMMRVLDVKKEKMAPNELIQSILKAPVDLLWNGGIGTFIKATEENNNDVGDRANDAIRIDAKELRAKVFGEGGNLGSTQLARIEFAENGGYVNTDAIDNSAGVNCSDIEVNIKILLRLAEEKGQLKSKERNKLLESMTGEVGELAADANYRQSQILSIAQVISKDMLEPHKRLMTSLEKKGFLHRKIEYLPNEEELELRAKEERGLTRPELSVLMAYAKMDLYNTLVNSHLPSEKVMEDLYLYDYFPVKLQNKYKNLMQEHRLKTEIIATQVTNELINRMGMTFMDRMMDETGHEACTITRAFVISKRLLDAQKWYDMIYSLDNKVNANIQKEMRNVVKRLLEANAFWFLRNGKEKPLSIEKALSHFQVHFDDVRQALPKQLTGDMKSRVEKREAYWLEAGVPAKIAKEWSFIPTLNCSADVATIVMESKQKVNEVMDLHFRVGESLELDLLHKRTRDIPVTNNWQRVGSLSIIEQLYGYQKQITGQVIEDKRCGKIVKTGDAVKCWLGTKNGSMTQYFKFIEELRDNEETSHAMLNVALGQLKGLVN